MEQDVQNFKDKATADLIRIQSKVDNLFDKVGKMESDLLDYVRASDYNSLKECLEKMESSIKEAHSGQEGIKEEISSVKHSLNITNNTVSNLTELKDEVSSIKKQMQEWVGSGKVLNFFIGILTTLFIAYVSYNFIRQPDSQNKELMKILVQISEKLEEN